MTHVCLKALQKWGVLGENPTDEGTRNVVNQVFSVKATIAVLLTVTRNTMNLVFSNNFRRTEAFIK